MVKVNAEAICSFLFSVDVVRMVCCERYREVNVAWRSDHELLRQVGRHRVMQCHMELAALAGKTVVPDVQLMKQRSHPYLVKSGSHT